MCRKRLSSPRCRSELIDSAWVVIVPGQKCINKKKHYMVMEQANFIDIFKIFKLRQKVEEATRLVYVK